LEHWGVPFSRTEDGKIYQRPFGGMTLDYGKGQAQRTCAAADRTGHAMLHTMYGQALRHAAEFYIEFFAIDLIMDDQGSCRGVIALKLDDGTLHRFRAQTTILATAAMAAPMPPAPRRIPAPATARHGAAGRTALQDMEFVQFHPQASTARAASSPKARAAKAAISSIPKASASWSAMRLGQGPRLARRGLALDDHRDPRGPRRRKKKDHIFLHLDHLDPKVLAERLPGISNPRASSPMST